MQYRLTESAAEEVSALLVGGKMAKDNGGAHRITEQGTLRLPQRHALDVELAWISL